MQYLKYFNLAIKHDSKTQCFHRNTFRKRSRYSLYWSRGEISYFSKSFQNLFIFALSNFAWLFSFSLYIHIHTRRGHNGIPRGYFTYGTVIIIRSLLSRKVISMLPQIIHYEFISATM